MRPDGIRIKHEDPMYHLIPYFLRHRYDAMNMITLDIPEEPMRAYMNQKRKEGRAVSHMAIFMTAYLKTVMEYPALNRFVKGRKIYQHKDITIAMAVLKAGGEDTLAKIYLEPEDDIFSVQKKITDFADQNRQEGEANSLDKAMNFFVNKLTFLTGLAIRLVWILDALGLLPNSLIRISPFHSSLLVSNLASIRTNHIYHHVYEFGTTSMSVTMGNMREIPRRSRDGIVFDRCMPLGVVMDERIANGHYMAQAFAQMKRYMSNPALMENPAPIAE